MTGGFTIEIKILKDLKILSLKNLKKKYQQFNYKTLYLDSVIAPTALNIEFFNKVNARTFGSGNPEPKFVLEDMKSVNNKIIKNKHKVVLVGIDGSTIKTIAFNCVDNEIGAYLLKNNKLFNIAGKLSLNEWQGQSNMEFIIDDISVNKTLKIRSHRLSVRTVGFHPTKRVRFPWDRQNFKTIDKLNWKKLK